MLMGNNHDNTVTRLVCLYVTVNLSCADINVNIPDSKVHGDNMGPIWGRQDPGGPHVGPMNFAIWDMFTYGLFVASLDN